MAVLYTSSKLLLLVMLTGGWEIWWITMGVENVLHLSRTFANKFVVHIESEVMNIKISFFTRLMDFFFKKRIFISCAKKVSLPQGNAHKT